ncbi:MAG: GTP-binding protein HflX [Bermanella sp.]
MLFERPKSGERAVLVHIEFSGHTEREDPGEFLLLVKSAGGEPMSFIRGQRQGPKAGTFVGSGKLEEIRQAVVEHEAEVVLFNHSLSPSQERNIEAALQCRVLDRTGLILDIFAQRARTHEGKLQVELAQLEHMSTRLVRGWTHLERQKGGIGLRGPGETQLESDRRLLRARIKAIQARLGKVRKQRDQSRRARRRAEIPTLSFVGYTNAGKSTLFNSLTQSEVYAADQLFATLDPTMRRLQLADVGPVVLADTVGFIRHLPHKLIESFRATLEEAVSSDLLVHVVDSADDERDGHRQQVHAVLAEIGADQLPMLEVYNKIDLSGQSPRIDRDASGKPYRVWLSARRGQGLELLAQALSELLAGDVVEADVLLSPEKSRLRSRLFAQAGVQAEAYSEEGAMLHIRMPRGELLKLLAAEGEQLENLQVQVPLAAQ